MLALRFEDRYFVFLSHSRKIESLRWDEFHGGPNSTSRNPVFVGSNFTIYPDNLWNG
ncbi:MAG: hypothetical protein H6606_09805 [Flavobacteriales bacterium]|nr:hypothetical protein [Flavobacteriales bacterium]